MLLVVYAFPPSFNADADRRKREYSIRTKSPRYVWCGSMIAVAEIRVVESIRDRKLIGVIMPGSFGSPVPLAKKKTERKKVGKHEEKKRLVNVAVPRPS